MAMVFFAFKWFISVHNVWAHQCFNQTSWKVFAGTGVSKISPKIRRFERKCRRCGAMKMHNATQCMFSGCECAARRRHEAKAICKGTPLYTFRHMFGGCGVVYGQKNLCTMCVLFCRRNGNTECPLCDIYCVLANSLCNCLECLASSYSSCCV